jgi:hypothetical protein
MASRKHRKIKWESVGLNSLVLLFVLFLLSYTFIHTGAVLARFINPPALGYIAALGIEGLVATMSWRRAFKAGATISINVTLGIVLAISAVANLYEGYAVKNGHELTLSDIPHMDALQAFVGVLVTAIVPFLVFMAGEVMGRGLEELGKFISEGVAGDAIKIEVPATISEAAPTLMCEFCDEPLKDASRFTRSAHLRYCKVYKTEKVKTNGNV